MELLKKALTRLGIDYEVVNYCEIDKYASCAYSAIHNIPQNKNIGDITKVDTIKLTKDIDLITYGFPCQSYSVAGKQLGVNDPRGVLFFDALKIIRLLKPKYCIAENVKNLTSRKFKEVFENMLAELEYAGYNNYWKVLNAKDYGIPQNRERVFIISIRKDVDDDSFRFPEPFDNGLRLRDFLEDEVDEKYYINQEKTEKLIRELENKEISNTIRANGNGSLDKHQWDLVLINSCSIKIKKDNICNCIDANYGKGLDKHAQRTGVMQIGFINKNQQGTRIYDINGVAVTQNAQGGGWGAKTGLYEVNYKIRRLTPLLKCIRWQVIVL